MSDREVIRMIKAAILTISDKGYMMKVQVQKGCIY